MKKRGDSYRQCPKTGRCNILENGQETGKWFSSPVRAQTYLARRARSNPGMYTPAQPGLQRAQLVTQPPPDRSGWRVDVPPPPGSAPIRSYGQGGASPGSIRRSAMAGPWYIISLDGTWSVWNTPDRRIALQRAQQMLLRGDLIASDGSFSGKKPVRNPLTSYRGVRLQKQAGVVRYTDPRSKQRISISQRKGGLKEAKKRIDEALRIRARFSTPRKTRFDR